MSRNKELNEKIKDDRRLQILDTALELFASNGLAGTKITDISTKSGISQGLIYHYFTSKEDIYTELIRHAISKMNTAAQELEKLNLSPVDKIILAIEGLLKGLEENKNKASYYYLLITQATISDSIPLAVKSIINKELYVPFEIIKQIFIEGQKDKTIKNYDPHDMSLTFWVIIKGLALSRATRDKNFKMPDIGFIKSIFLVNS